MKKPREFRNLSVEASAQLDTAMREFFQRGWMVTVKIGDKARGPLSAQAVRAMVKKQAEALKVPFIVEDRGRRYHRFTGEMDSFSLEVPYRKTTLEFLNYVRLFPEAEVCHTLYGDMQPGRMVPVCSYGDTGKAIMEVLRMSTGPVKVRAAYSLLYPNG